MPPMLYHHNHLFTRSDRRCLREVSDPYEFNQILDATWSSAHLLEENANLVWELPGEEREIEWRSRTVKIENNLMDFVKNSRYTSSLVSLLYI